MSSRKYYEKILAELEIELTHQKAAIPGLKKILKHLQEEEWSPLEPFQAVMLERETRKKNVEKALEQIRARIK